MNDTGIENPLLSHDEKKQEPALTFDRKSESARTTEIEMKAEASTPDLLMSREAIASRIERLQLLGSDLNSLLLVLSKEVNASMEQLNGIQAEIAAKKGELKMLCEIEASSAALEQLIRDQQSERDGFERLMENQRRVWEEEKALRIREEKEYLESLKIHRQQEEEEYRHTQAMEQLKAQQKLEEELRIIQQKNLEKQKLLESEFQERDRQLREKELEWERLIEELEQFISRLAERTQSGAAAYADAQWKTALFRRDPSQALKSSPPACPEDRLAGDKVSDCGDSRYDLSSDSFFRSPFLDEPTPLLSSLKEILHVQGRKTENESGESSMKRDCTTLKFSPKKVPNPKTQI